MYDLREYYFNYYLAEFIFKFHERSDMFFKPIPDMNPINKSINEQEN